MRRVLSCFVLIWLIAGCGGGAANNNPFAGTWTGKWTDSTAATTGTLALTITNSGGISGTVTNTTASTNASVVGTVNAGGQVNATYEYSGAPETEVGIVDFGPTGQLQGSLAETQSGASVGSALISLAKQ